MSLPAHLNAGLLRSLPDAAPVVMVNLVRIRDWEGYRRYSELAMPLIKARGGTVLWAGNAEAVALGDPQAHCWNYVVLVRYPTRAAFLDMMESREYAAANKVREAACEDHAIIAADEAYSKLGKPK